MFKSRTCSNPEKRESGFVPRPPRRRQRENVLVAVRRRAHARSERDHDKIVGRSGQEGISARDYNPSDQVRWGDQVIQSPSAEKNDNPSHNATTLVFFKSLTEHIAYTISAQAQHKHSRSMAAQNEKSETCTCVPLTRNTLSTPSASSLERSNRGSATHPLVLSHRTFQSTKLPRAVLPRMLSPVALGALEGRSANRVPAPGPVRGAMIFPRFPMTVGVPVMLLTLGRADGRGRGVRVQNAVGLRQ